MRRIGEKGLGARVVGASRALDQVAHRVPPARQDGGPGQRERQLDMLDTGGPVEHRRRDSQSFGMPDPGDRATEPARRSRRQGEMGRLLTRRAAARHSGTLPRPCSAAPG